MLTKLAAFFKNQTHPHTVVVVEGYSELTLYLRSNEYPISWHIGPCEKQDNPWIDFVKWFHEEPQTPFYVMEANDSQQCLRRDDIMRYRIAYHKRSRAITQ